VSLARYALIVLAIVGGSLLLLVPALSGVLDRAGLVAMLFGGALAAFNTLLAFGIVSWSERRSTNAFLGAVLGGMVGRMAMMLAAVVAAVLLLGLPKVPLAVSLLSYFVLLLVLELSVLQKKTTPHVHPR
jgi:hypothetical protein